MVTTLQAPQSVKKMAAGDALKDPERVPCLDRVELNRSAFHRDSAVLIPLSSGSRCLCGVVCLLVFGWWEVAEVAVQAAAVVPMHPAEGGEFDVV